MPSFARNTTSRRFAVPYTLVVGFVVAALTTLIIALVNYHSSETRSSAVKSMDRTMAAMRQLNAFHGALKDAETAQRSYLLTGDNSYLQPYQIATSGMERHLQNLRASTEEDASHARLVQQIDELSRQKLRELDEGIGLLRRGDREAALAQVQSDAGRDLIERVRELIDHLYGLQSEQMEMRRKTWVDAATASTLYSWLGSAILLLLIALWAALAGREYRAKAQQSWVAAGLSGLGQRLQGEHRLEDLAPMALEYLATYLRAAVGTSYVRAAQGGFALAGGYAVPRERLANTILEAEGLVGEAARSRKRLHLRQVPAQHLGITSGTGHSAPVELLVAPAMDHDTVYAVIELGFLHPLTQAELELIDAASPILASAFRSSQDRTQLEDLLEETQRQSEELQTQQEELRVSNEELEQQSRILQSSQAQMEVQQTELEQTNAHLETQTQQLEQQRAQLLQVQSALEHKALELEKSSQFKSEFLANMSHELRTPLNSTLILAKLLAENKGGNLSADQVKYAQTIFSAGNDLLALINDILDLAKIESGQAHVAVESLSVEKTVQALAEPLRVVAEEKGITLTTQIDPDVPAAMETDPMRLGQVIKNLLSNAVKFTAHGGVELRVRMQSPDTLAFEVRDSGIGIPEHQQTLIFDAFRQADGSTHRKYGGTGLGLSISRDLAHLLGGNITVQSHPGEGSVFTLTLPVQLTLTPSPADQSNAMQRQPQAAGPLAGVALTPAWPSPSQASLPPRLSASLAAPSTQSPPPAAAARAGARSLLIIEDDKRFSDILRDLAVEMGFECLVAFNAQDGLAIAAQSLPSAIVLDVNLPDFSGLGVLDQLKRTPATRHIPVHVVSGANYAQEAMGRGAVGYALKPVKREELVDALELLEAKFTQKLHRVLVVEADARQRESVQELLSRDDVEIVCAATASAALEQLRTSTFDCVVMDLNLPDVSGHTLLEQMAQEDGVSFPPVIVYTGHALSRDEEQQLQRYARSIIIKDARSPERLLDEVTLFLHQVESELPLEHQRMLEMARSRESALQGRNVLIVEDDVRNVFALSSILEPTGMRLEIARNGVEALQALQRSLAPGATPIDLVLMDIMMPEMDGYTAMREIRKSAQWQRLPIIALTAKAMKDDQEKCLAAGANDYIAKPLDIEKLLSLVRVWMPK